ncbi:MAG: hypothetical protein KKA55_06985 [Proteobacteria bacterium]|nr:hypothetical protein [Pseudomonadota bacterium]MBU1595263.1 hypothetical protein [Pseudomonadota bacterium]
MFVLVYSLAAMGLTILAQALIWRALQPRNHTTLMLKVFGWGFALAVCALAGLLAAWPDVLSSFSTGYAVGLFALFYVPMALMYISFHTLLQFDSPTLTIVALAAETGAQGCPETELAALLGSRDMVAERLEEARQGGLTETVGGSIQLTAKGRMYAKIFDVAARVFNLRRAG